MLHKKQEEKFWDYYKSARNNDVLSPKTTYIAHMAAAMALGCDP